MCSGCARCSLGHFGDDLQGLKSLRENYSFAPLGLAYVPLAHPRLAPWAAFLRRFAAET